MTKVRASKKKRKRCRKGLVIFCLVWLMAGAIRTRNDMLPFLMDSIGENADSHVIPVAEEWNLIVVNRWNKIPEDFSISLTELSNGQKVDSRIYPYLQEMFDGMRDTLGQEPKG